MNIAQRAAGAVVWFLKVWARYFLLLFGIWGIGAALWTGTVLWLVGAIPLVAYVGIIMYRSYRGAESAGESAAE